MRKVIDGLLYDTKKAEVLGFDDYGYAGDFESWTERLYRTPKGAYFLAGEGGALTKYGRPAEGGGMGGGWAITPLSEAEAKRWMEHHCTTSEYMEAFGSPEEA
jgi:hypothetical protein